jgi:hypothetical protein
VPRKLEELHEEIRKKIADCPDMTLPEILEWLENDHNMKVSISTLHAELCRLDLTWKTKSLQAEEQKRDDVAEERENWRKDQGNLDPAKVVFIDETAITTDMTRTHGRSPRGETLLGYKPNGHRNTTTFIGALRQEGMTAPCLVDGPVDGDMFRAYVEQMLLPTLGSSPRASIERGRYRHYGQCLHS